MKKAVLNTISGILFTISLFALIFQGFAMPSLNDFAGTVLRILASASAQLLFLLNIKKIWLQQLPLYVTAAIALWGGYLFSSSESWQNVKFYMYLCDYCSPLLGSILVCTINKIK